MTNWLERLGARNGVNCWASENLSGQVHFEGYSPKWRVLSSKLSVHPVQKLENCRTKQAIKNVPFLKSGRPGKGRLDGRLAKSLNKTHIKHRTPRCIKKKYNQCCSRSKIIGGPKVGSRGMHPREIFLNIVSKIAFSVFRSSSLQQFITDQNS